MSDYTEEIADAVTALTVEARRIADALTAPLPGEDDGPHSCPPGHLYYCPTAGEWESSCHGGFDTCCDRPDLHRAASEAIPRGGNAEDCPRCTDPNPPYPFLCPGHPSPDAARTTPDNPPTSSDAADNPQPATAPETDQPAEEECCGSEPPADGTWGDCWCTLPSDHDGDCRCEPCTERHGAPGWNTDDTPTTSEDTTRHVGTSTIGEPATPGRATITIAVTAPNQDNANRWAETIRDLVTAEHGHHMRLDITISDGQQHEPDSDDGLREQYATALHAAHREWMRPGSDAGQHLMMDALADAVLTVRDRRIKQLTARAEGVERSVQLLTTDLLNVAQQRDQAEAAIARVHALAERWKYTSDRKNGPRKELLTALNGPQPATAEPGPAEAQPTIPTTKETR